MSSGMRPTVSAWITAPCDRGPKGSRRGPYRVGEKGGQRSISSSTFGNRLPPKIAAVFNPVLDDATVKELTGKPRIRGWKNAHTQ